MGDSCLKRDIDRRVVEEDNQFLNGQRTGEPNGRLTAVSHPSKSGLASVPPYCGCVAMTSIVSVVC